ncbi:MAG: tyrosine-type recombinase/integrase [Simkaniaceae bacterium]|nr:tyrosine-type recombinase/integrase [Simkaniaceae bacterium]
MLVVDTERGIGKRIPLRERVEELAKLADADKTKELKKTVCRKFIDFCNSEVGSEIVGRDELHSGDLVCLFIAYCEREGGREGKGCLPSTIKTYTSILRGLLEEEGYPVKRGHKGIRDLLRAVSKTGAAPQGKTPLTTPSIRALCRATEESAHGLQERAIILLAYGSACRTSEIVSLNVEDLSFVEEGVTLFLRRSKTDQEGEGCRRDVVRGDNPRFCPVITLKRHLEETGRKTGPLFKSPCKGDLFKESRISNRYYPRVLQRLAEKAKVEGDIAGHSTRSGHVTQAIKAGVDHMVIAVQTAHKDFNSLKRYVRMQSEFKRNSSASLGL